MGSSGKEEVEDEAGSGRARGRGSEIHQLRSSVRLKDWVSCFATELR